MSLYDAADFEEFWRGYQRLHARRETQRWHAVATLAAATLLALGIALRQPLLLVAAPVADYAIAQASHRLFERNVTQPWRHPRWHLRAELRLFWRTVRGVIMRR
jgi:hypothetical protein